MILVVDLCGTLITENTTHAFLRWLRLRGTAHLRSVLGQSRAVSWLDHKTGRDIGRRLQILSMKGLDRELLYAEASKYIRSRLVSHVNSRVLEHIRQVKEQSFPVYLATSTLDPIADAVLRELELTSMVCSRVEYDSNGICTGRLALDILGNKWQALSRFIPDQSSPLTLYTDNPEDTDLMERATHVYYLGQPDGVVYRDLSKFTFI